jgi:hypothetical protein
LAKILDIIPYKILPAEIGGQKNIAIFCKYLGEQHELTGISVKNNDISKAEHYELIRLFSTSRLRYLNPFYLKQIKKIIPCVSTPKTSGTSIIGTGMGM